MVDEFFVVEWTDAVAAKIQAPIGRCSAQTCWELYTLLLVLLIWGDQYQDTSLAVLGDNTASLQVALTMKSSASLRLVARELALHQSLKCWHFTVGHIPTELNLIADALSRLRGSQPSVVLPCLRNARQISVPPLSAFWQTS